FTCKNHVPNEIMILPSLRCRAAVQAPVAGVWIRLFGIAIAGRFCSLLSSANPVKSFCFAAHQPNSAAKEGQYANRTSRPYWEREMWPRSSAPLDRGAVRD